MYYTTTKKKLNNGEVKLVASPIGVETHDEDEILDLIVASGKENGIDIAKSLLISIACFLKTVLTTIVKAGGAVKTELFTIYPGITGTASIDVSDESYPFTPKVNMWPGGALKECAAEIHLERDPHHYSGAYITGVFDGGSGTHDKRLTPNSILVVEGVKIKVTGNAEGVGVHFISQETGADTLVPKSGCTLNLPSQLTLLTPPLSPGKYILRVITMYRGSTSMLTEPRMVTFEKVLTVASPAEASFAAAAAEPAAKPEAAAAEPAAKSEAAAAEPAAETAAVTAEPAAKPEAAAAEPAAKSEAAAAEPAVGTAAGNADLSAATPPMQEAEASA